MARGPKKHLKRLAAPKHWMLDKLSGVYAPKASAGPHKTRECLPLLVFIRNRLKYALTYHEVKMILKQRQVLVDNRIRTDVTYPTGFMDVISVPKTNEHFRLIYDVKGRFTVHPIKPEEAKFKLGRVINRGVYSKGMPYVVLHDGRTVPYPDPAISVNDTVKLNLDTGRIDDFIKFEVGVTVMAIRGRNNGRVGHVVSTERHPGSHDIVHVKDSLGHTFATRLGNVFVIGKGGSAKPMITLPKGKGNKLSIAEERDRRLQEKSKASA
jgi:small subunit ribosomal protein S4e